MRTLKDVESDLLIKLKEAEQNHHQTDEKE